MTGVATRGLDPDACRALVTGERWLSRITVTDSGCWVTGYSTPSSGYAQVGVGGRMARAHRVALVAHLGRDIRPGMQAGHVCHDLAYAAGECVATDANPCQHRLCVNPEHLVEQTHRENLLSGGAVTAVNAAKVSCFRCGEPLTPRGDGKRHCRPCMARRDALRSQAHRALGIRREELRELFGQSERVLSDILARLDEGVRPEVIVGEARVALCTKGDA